MARMESLAACAQSEADGPRRGQWLTALEPEACQVGLRHLCGPCAGGLRAYGV